MKITIQPWKKSRVMLRTFILSCLFLLPTTSTAEDLDITYNGYGWVQMGQIMQHSDSIFHNFNGNWMQSAATQVTALVKIDEHWSGALGIGGGQYHRMQSRDLLKARELKMSFAAYITQARFTYATGKAESGRIESTFGYFPYNYNPNIKNLGLYLLRGPVYPGVLESGFEVPAVLPIANIQGTHLSFTLGSFTQDLLLFTELEYKPLYDFSGSVKTVPLGEVKSL